MKTHKVNIDDGLCASARRLLASGEAQPEDRIEAYRQDQLCLSGIIGRVANLEVSGTTFIKYKEKENEE